MNFSDITIRELIDIPSFKNLLESFSKVTGLATAILDSRGEVIAATGWQTICTQFHRKNKLTSARCLESDTILAENLSHGGQYNIYKCKNGLVDICVPVIIESTHVGNLFIGQFLMESPDITSFTQQADEFGFNKELYLEALSKVPVLSLDKVNNAIKFLANLTTVIGTTGLDRKRLLELNMNLEKSIEERTAELSFINERLCVLTEATFEGIILSRNHIIIDANNIAAEIFGYKEAKELIDLKIFDLIEPENWENVEKKIMSAYENPYETIALHRDGTRFPIEVRGKTFNHKGQEIRGTAIRDLTERKTAEKEIQTLRGILPICTSCKKIRDDNGYWEQVELYVSSHSEAEFTHSLCPECIKILYPDII